MADVLDIENSEEFEVDEDGERKSYFVLFSINHSLNIFYSLLNMQYNFSERNLIVIRNIICVNHYKFAKYFVG